jgi:hypothetical protein
VAIAFFRSSRIAANPLDDISNVRRVNLVMRSGRMYESVALWRAIGFHP